MRQRGEALGPRIGADEKEHGQSESNGPGVRRLGEKKKRRGYHEAGATKHGEGPNHSHAQLPGREMTTLSAWVGGIDVPVREAIEGHGGRPREYHAQHDADKLEPGERLFGVPGKYGAEEGERQ